MSYLAIYYLFKASKPIKLGLLFFCMDTLDANYTNLNTNRINQTQKMQLKYPMVWLEVRGRSSHWQMCHISIMLMKSTGII